MGVMQTFPRGCAGTVEQRGLTITAMNIKNQEGGMGRVYQLFGAELPTVLEALNQELAA